MKNAPTRITAKRILYDPYSDTKEKKTLSITEQRAKIKQLRDEQTNPELKASRLEAEQLEADRKAAITKDKLEKWMMMKMLKGEWEEHDKPIDIDKWSRVASVRGRVQK